MNRSGLSVVSKSNLLPITAEQHAQPRLNETMVPHGHQLSLPFVNEITDRRTFIVPMDHIHGGRLCNLIMELKPQAVIDLRHVIRFDLPGTNRDRVFRHIRAVGSCYMTIPVPWHQFQARDFMAGETSLSDQLTQEVVKREGSPVLLFVSRRTEVRLVATYIHQILSSQARSSWQVVEAV